MDRISASLARADALDELATKRVKQSRQVESLEEAENRICALKLDDVELRLVRDVFALWRLGKLDMPKGRLSKKSVIESWETWVRLERERKIRKVIDTKPDNCLIITDFSTLKSLWAMLQDEDVVSLDTETTGLDLFEDKVVGIAGYFPKADVQFYIPFGHTTGQKQLDRAVVLDFYADCVKGHKTLWHNYKFDAHMTMNEGIVPDAPWWDTMIAMKILNNNETNYRLKDLYAKYVSGEESILFEDLFPDYVIFDKDIILSGIYAAGDAYKTWKLYEFQKPYIDTRDNLKTVWYEIEQKLLHIDALTERNGVNVDLEWLDTLRTELVPRLEEAEAKVRSAYELPDNFNFKSPVQLAHLVYDIAGADPNFPLRFRKAPRSTSAEVIDALCSDLPQLVPLLEFRTMEKLLGTYVEKIPGAMEPTTGRLHFQLNSTDTDTGRYASRGYGNKSKPKGINIQNIPTRTKEGVRVRQAFVPAPGNLFVSSDLSQIEPRVIAHILKVSFGDESMATIYAEGKDIYTTSAQVVFGLPYENCVDGAYDPTGSFKPRSLMKTGTLAYLYGQTEKSFAGKMGVDIEVATKFFSSMASAFPGLVRFRASIIAGLLTDGPVAFAETLFGRKRRFPQYRSNYAELSKLESQRYFNLPKGDKDRLWELRRAVSSVQRQAVNTRIQGSAADILKQIVIRIATLCVENSWKFICSIHDEIWTEIPKEDVTIENIAFIEDCMTKTVTLSVPLKCDTVIATRWMMETKVRDWDFERGQPKEVA